MSLGMGVATGWADPSTGQIWPLPVDPATGAVIGSGLVSARVVEAIPAVARAMGVIAGRMSQMPLALWEGKDLIEPTPPLLVKPDPTVDYPSMMNALCWDYWLHGNAILYETVHEPEYGLPLAAMWLPAERVNVWKEPEGKVWYEVGGTILDTRYVRHMKRRLDPWRPWRGIGAIEQHMRAFAKISDQQAYESRLLQDSAVPSIAVTVGNPDLSEEEAERAKGNWLGKFSGPRREPVFLPAGSSVEPLAWSPHDAQMVEAQKMSRGDVADIFDLDRFYLGVSDGSFNYKTWASMSRALVQDTLGEHMRAFEAVLTEGWCLPGREIRFDPSGVIVDDLDATMTWLGPAHDRGMVTTDEARARLGLPPFTDEQRAETEARMIRSNKTAAPTIEKGETR